MNDRVLSRDRFQRRPELAGFDEFFIKHMAPWLKRQVLRQNKARNWAWIWITIGALGGFALYLTLDVFGLHDKSWAFVVYTLCMMGIAFSKLMVLQADVNTFLLEKVCEFFGFVYNRSPRTPVFHKFFDSGLLPAYDECRFEDHIRGHHEGVDFDLVECVLSRKSRGSRDRKTILHGVLFVFTFPKTFSGFTLVLTDKGMIGRFFRDLVQQGEAVVLEDPRFEGLFDVWSSDQVEARYLLTPTFMERVVDLAHDFGKQRIEFCFKGNRLLMVLHADHDQFEGGGMFDNVKDLGRMEDLVNEICRVFDIIAQLNLTLKSSV